MTASETIPLPELRIDIPDDLHDKIEAAKPIYLDRKGFVCLILDQALDFENGGATLPAYRVGAGNRVGYDQKLPLQFPPQLEVTSSEAQHTAVLSQEFETSKKDLGVNSKKPRSKRTKGCDEFETFWKTYTRFEHRANKQEKPKALKAWNETTKHTSHEELMDALAKAHDEISDKVANQTFYSSMPDCHRWLKGECYAVYLEGNTTVQSNNNIW